jgi:hemerythrin
VLVHYAKWNEALETGDAIVDDQHRSLYALVNDLNADTLLGRNPALAEVELERILRYATEHFATEESLMQLSAYPRTAAHSAVHREFAEQATGMVAAHLEGHGPTLQDLAEFMQSWLDSHIRDEDQPLIEHVRAAGLPRR